MGSAPGRGRKITAELQSEKPRRSANCYTPPAHARRKEVPRIRLITQNPLNQARRRMPIIKAALGRLNMLSPAWERGERGLAPDDR
jgi:hypothetical protein